jgi:hypothetical protein
LPHPRVEGFWGNIFMHETMFWKANLSWIPFLQHSFPRDVSKHGT